jgi:hypothetical protein
VSPDFSFESSISEGNFDDDEMRKTCMVKCEMHTKFWLETSREQIAW